MSKKVVSVNDKVPFLHGKLIEAKGIVPSGSINITENGTYPVEEYAEAVVNVSGGGGTFVGAYKILHEVVTVQSAFSGNVVALSKFLMGLTSFSDKNFLWFSLKPKDSYAQNEWYCAGAYISNSFGLGTAHRGYRYHDNVWAISNFANGYDAAATVGSQYDVYAVDYTAPI